MGDSNENAILHLMLGSCVWLEGCSPESSLFQALCLHDGACQWLYGFNMQSSSAHIPHAYRAKQGSAIDVEYEKFECIEVN